MSTMTLYPINKEDSEFITKKEFKAFGSETNQRFTDLKEFIDDGFNLMEKYVSATKLEIIDEIHDSIESSNKELKEYVKSLNQELLSKILIHINKLVK